MEREKKNGKAIRMEGWNGKEGIEGADRSAAPPAVVPARLQRFRNGRGETEQREFILGFPSQCWRMR